MSTYTHINIPMEALRRGNTCVTVCERPLTCGPSSGPFLASWSSVWLELQQELDEKPGPFTRLCKEWFSWASLSTSALASWKRQLRNSRSSLVLRCHPSISSQRWRKARLLRRKASGGQKGEEEEEAGKKLFSFWNFVCVQYCGRFKRKTLKCRLRLKPRRDQVTDLANERKLGRVQMDKYFFY